MSESPDERERVIQDALEDNFVWCGGEAATLAKKVADALARAQLVEPQEPVAWAALETLEGRKIVRELQDPYEYRPWDRQRGANIRRNLNMVPLYAAPARVSAQTEPPAEFVLVPREPTMGMYDDWIAASKEPTNNDGCFGTWVAAYQAMLNAAPAQVPAPAPAEQALRKLCNEVGGILGVWEPELARLCSNTNISVLKLRLHEGLAVLSAIAKDSARTGSEG